MTFKEKCIQANIEYKRAYSYKYKHPELTEEQVLNYYLTSVSFAEKCRQAGIGYRMASDYKKRHKDLTEEQVILQCIELKNRVSFR